MQASRKPIFHIMVKPRGAVCNLECDYCYYLSKRKLYPDSRFRMNEALLKDYTRQLIRLNKASRVIFAWQGGEPTLMGLDFYKAAIQYQEEFCKPGTIIQNVLQTNGTTLDDYWCDFFRQNNFLVGLSMDGPQKFHDAYRKDKGGNPTFSRVFHGLKLLKKHEVDFNILTCVHSKNVEYPLEVYQFIRDRVEASFIQFIPIVQKDMKRGDQDDVVLHESSITGKQYGDFLIAVFDEWVKRDVGQTFVQLFDNALGKWMGAPKGLCVFNETCGEMLALEHNGDLYACDHFVDEEHKLGNITEAPLADLICSTTQEAFGKAKRDLLPHYCLECDVRFVCNGGCPKNRLGLSPTGEKGLNHLCDGYKAFFRHIDASMKIMVDLINRGRSPTEVMQIIAEGSPAKSPR